MRTKHGLIDFEDVYVEPNVWRQLGLSCRQLDGAVRQQCAGHLPFERQRLKLGERLQAALSIDCSGACRKPHEWTGVAEIFTPRA